MSGHVPKHPRSANERFVFVFVFEFVFVSVPSMANGLCDMWHHGNEGTLRHSGWQRIMPVSLQCMESIHSSVSCSFCFLYSLSSLPTSSHIMGFWFLDSANFFFFGLCSKSKQKKSQYSQPPSKYPRPHRFIHNAMAHRKLQQEIDRVFKKITEGLDIFNTFHERHENASNTSQKDKLENDLKREIKKLQKLREQIKVWQTSSDVKDKEKLLEHRRLVEVAMEQYKVIEKGSKVKAYSNTSLKAINDMDPEEKEKMECINFIQESIDDLETQYQNCEVEMDKLIAKKTKKNSNANEAKKEEIKEFQAKYRWHQQNLELALRLLENGELVVEDINEIKEDLVYFLTSNRDPNFIDNEYLYESLDLDANEILQHEVVTSFNGLNEKEPSPTPEEPVLPEQKPTPVEAVITPKKEKPKRVAPPLPATSSSSPYTQPPTPISTNGLTNTLKPAITPVKLAQPDIKWSSLIAGMNEVPTSSPQPSQPTAKHVEKSSVPLEPLEKADSQPSKQPSETEPAKPLQPLQQQPQSQPQPQYIATSLTSSLAAATSRAVPDQQVQSPHFKVDDSKYLIDSSIISLPPGIQDIILSFYSSRVTTNPQPKQQDGLNGIGSHRAIKNISNYLNQPRYYLFNDSQQQQQQQQQQQEPIINGSGIKLNYSKDLSLEFQKCFNDWNKIRSSLNFPLDSSKEEINPANSQLLSSTELSTLFYGYYFSLTPFESHLISKELTSRGWELLDGGKSWGFKRSSDSLQNQGVERISKFDVESWNLVEVVEKGGKTLVW